MPRVAYSVDSPGALVQCIFSEALAWSGNALRAKAIWVLRVEWPTKKAKLTFYRMMEAWRQAA